MPTTLVLLESPFKASPQWSELSNIAYAKRCLKDCFDRGEYPFASHLLYPQVLNDTDAAQRELGIAAGLAWGRAALKTVVYTDHGISEGMMQGITVAANAGRGVEFRKLPLPVTSAGGGGGSWAPAPTPEPPAALPPGLESQLRGLRERVNQLTRWAWGDRSPPL